MTAEGLPEQSVLRRLRAIAPTLSVGVLTADLLSLGSELAVLQDAGVELVHVDMMDGRFCPMMTVGPPFVKALKSPLLVDVHLMVEDPLAQVESCVAAGADLITFQVESTLHPHRVLQALGKMPNAKDPARGIVRGVGLNPGTPVEAVEPLLDELELVLLLAVNPGWGGQSFIADTARKLEQVRDMLRRRGREILVMVDGGITRGNIAEVAAMGWDLIVTGSAVFDGKAAAENARFMLDQVARKG